MSTAAIAEILERLKQDPNSIGDAGLTLHAIAVDELMAIRRAARFISTVDTEAVPTPALLDAAEEASDLFEAIGKETA